MRNPFLLTALVAAISGCTSPPKTTQVQANAWVDQQIAQSATAISLAQRRLHQTVNAPVQSAPVNKIASSSAATAIAQPATTPPLETRPSAGSTQTPGKPPLAGASPKPVGQVAVLPVAAKGSTSLPAKDVVASPAKPLAVIALAPVQDKPAPPVKPVTPPPPPLPTWTASVGSTLHKSVAEWCERANVKLIWTEDDLDYPIEAPLTFKGTFQQVIAQLFPLYDGAKRSFIVDGNSSQGILYVSERKK